ncbi:MAG TPA: hypothetical protein VNG91_07020 [Terriglobia bacterium]|nr:hypothetical protein [Terriglobia bacterium]
MNSPKPIFHMPTFLASLPIEAYMPFGSWVMCNPAPIDADEDWLVLVKPGYAPELKKLLEKRNFYPLGAPYSDANMLVYRRVAWLVHRKQIDIAVFDNKILYALNKLAAEICTEMNLLDRAARVAVFDSVVRGKMHPKDSGRPAEAG